MADVPGKFYRATKVRTGVAPSSAGSIEGEVLPPVNPPGSSLNSVGLTMPSAFTVSNSPLTANGTIGVTGAGTVAQYIRGDGSLADFPESSGGGSSVSYYLNGSVDQGTIGGVAYKELSKVPILGAGTDFTINADGYIASFITDAGDPNLLEIPGGNWNFETYFSASSSGGTPTFYVELYKVSSVGTATLIASSSSAPELIAFGTNLNPYFSTLAVPTTTLALTDRLSVRYYVTHSGRTITLHTENNHLCQIVTTFTTGITALNGLTAQVQNFAVGTSGTDFNIASATATHTFNLPTASATNRGALSSADWALFTQAYNDKINSASVTGTTTKTLTLTQQDGGTITASWSDLNTDAVLSVFGRTGAVVAANGDYTTAQVTESGNLYYTDARSRAALSFAAGSGAYNTSTGVITIPTNNNQITNGAGYITSAALAGYLPLTGGTLTGPLGGTTISLSSDITANRYRGVNSLVLNSYTTVNPSSNVYLYSPPNDRDAWIYLDSADTGSNWGIYHRQIDSAVSGLPANSIGFVGGGSSTLQAWISLANGNGYYAGNLLVGNNSDNGARLQVSGTATVSSNLTVGNGTTAVSLIINRGAAGDGNGLRFATAGTLNWYIGSAATSTNTDLEIYNHNTATTNLRLAYSTGAATFGSNVTASSFIRSGGTSSQYLMADGSVSTLSNPVTGTGTTNYLPKFTGSTTIGNSQIFDDGTRVSINYTSFPAANYRFQVRQGTNRIFGIADQDGELSIESYNDAVNAGVPLRIYSTRTQILNGNVHIGSTPSADNGAKLQVSGGNVTVTNSGNVLTTIRSTSNTGVAIIYTQNDINNSCELGTWGSARAGFGAIQPNNGYIYAVSDLAIGSPTNLKFSTGASNSTRLTIDSSGAATFSSSVTAASDSSFNGVNVGRGGGSIFTNTRIGNLAFVNNTTGANNTSVGYGSLGSNTTGNGNSAFGKDSLAVNTSGTNNSALGLNALVSNTTGGTNTSLGFSSLGNNTTGSNNAALGSYAGSFVTGGGPNNTSSNSVYLGADSRGSASGNTNEIVIGYDARGEGSNTAVIGNSSITKTILNGNILIGTATDNGNRLRVNGNTWFDGGINPTKTAKNTYAIHIRGSLFGAPRLQVYDLNADPNGYMGLGTDMSGAPYEFSNYFPRTAGNGRWSVGSWAGDFGAGQYVSGYNEKLFITESAAQFNTNLGIGVSPATNLHVQGASVSYGQIRFLNSSSSGEASIHIGRTNQTVEQRWTVGQGVAGIGDSFGFYTGGSSRVNLQTNGNLLIGTTSDVGAKLYVNGDIRTGALGGGYVSGYWKLGRAILGTQPSETYQIIVEINGQLYAIGAANL